MKLIIAFTMKDFDSRIKSGECLSNAASLLNNRQEEKHTQCQPLRNNRFDEIPRIFRIMLLPETHSVNNTMPLSDLGCRASMLKTESQNMFWFQQ